MVSSGQIIQLCFVSPTIYPFFNPQERVKYNEADIQIYELVRHFGQQQRYDVSVITGDYGQEEVEYYSGVLVYKSNMEESGSLLERLFSRSSTLRTTLKKVEAQVYFMAGARGLTREVAKYCRSKRYPFLFRVTHQRDCDQSFIHSGEEGEKYQWALRNASYVICQTREQQAMLLRKEKVKTEVIPNAISHGMPGEKERGEVLWFGEAAPWKQPELFLRLALSIPDHQFTMIISPTNREYLEKLIAKTRDIPNLGVQNSIPYQELPSLLQRGSILVNTSRFEGFPFIFCQAMAYGIPIASLNVDPEGVLEKNKVGIYARGSEVILLQNVQDLLTYEKQWRLYSHNALRYAMEHFHIQEVEKHYHRLFIRALGSARRKNER